jgi:opacity protein-like surface antigen
MKRILGALAGLTLVAAAAAPVAAQNVADMRPMRFGVQGGVSMPTGDFGDLANMGFIVGGLLDVKPASMPVGFRFNVDYQRWGVDSEIADGNFSSMSGTGAVMFTVPTTGGISPYLLGGVGMYRFDCSGDDLECEAENEFGFNLGGGLNFGLGTLDTGVEVRYHDAGDGSWITIPFIVRF